MEVSTEVLTKLAALVIAVGRYTAERDAGDEGDLDALKRVNKVAQSAAVEEISCIAFDAIEMCENARRAEGTIYWDTLIGKGE